MATAEVPTLELNTGTGIPQLGFGVFLIDPKDTEEAVGAALRTGYRHIDTAQMYGNEKQVGQAVDRSDLARSEVFVTSKLSNKWHSTDDALRAFDRSLEELGFDYLDLFLIHWPLPTVRDFVDVWRALERVHAEGRARAVGVSNFQQDHLERLAKESDLTPAANQIELHPYLTQEPLKAFGEERHILTEAWSPIGRGKVLDDSAIGEIAGAHSKTPAQAILRWHIQSGNIIFPKSNRTTRMQENFEIFDFSLRPDEMAVISGLDRGERIGPDPDTFDMVP
jgi:2,5-diketo-D-gluconate reductase A